MTTTVSRDNLSTLAARVRDLVRLETPSLIEIRRDLHAHPELMYQERRTSEVVQRELTSAGVPFKAGLARGTGVLGSLEAASGQSNGKAIGLRADMDALPILEQTDVAHTSTTPGVMHACGHDGHTTMLIGAARVLARIAEQDGLPNAVSFVFQPAEEGGAGGKAMIEDGCMDGTVIGPPIARMFGLHGWPELSVGCVGSRPGPMLAAADMFELTVSGTGAHAAYPHRSCDPVLAGAAIVQSLQQIVSRNTAPLDSVVVSVTSFHGGTTHNVIPESVEIAGTVRTLLPETKATTIERMESIVNNIAAAHGCTAGFEYLHAYPVTRNDPAMTEHFHNLARQTLGDANVQPLEEPVMGGEDFSFYCEQVPSCFFALGLLPHGQDDMPQLHQPTFDFNDDALATGIELFCRLAIETPTSN